MVVASKTSFNVGVILAGVTLTSAVVYYIGSELFGSQSTTNIFSDAVDRIRASEEIVNVVGEPIKAHGEPSRNSRRRNRRIASQVVEDQENKPHLFMRFYVEGTLNQGTVMLEMIKVIQVFYHKLYNNNRCYRMKRTNGNISNYMWTYQVKVYLLDVFI